MLIRIYVYATATYLLIYFDKFMKRKYLLRQHMFILLLQWEIV